MELFESLKDLLKSDERLVSDGKLLKNKIIELGLKLDKELIKLLLTNERIKEYFFKNIDGVLVFDKEKFVKFIDNKEFLPDSYTSFKNKIGLAADGNYIAKSKEVALVWPYKDCILEGGQEEPEEKRREIFYNEILAPDEIDRLLDPKVFTNFKRIDKEGEHKVEEIKTKDNIIIKGNNLLALYSLKKKFAGKIKLIYIDPPYYFRENKEGDTFLYNTNFKFSTWLTFMKDRLLIAKDLLAKKGVIFVQIGDDGLAALKLLLDEIFGVENFINIVSVKMKNIAGASGGGEDIRLKKNIEFICIYSKDVQNFERFENIYDYVELYELINRYRENGVSWKYTSVLVAPGEKEYIYTTTDGYGNNIKIYRRLNPVIKSINQIKEEESISEKEVYYKYVNKIFSTAMPQSSIRKRVQESVGEMQGDDDLLSIEYIPRTGRNKGVLYEQFYKGNKLRLISWLRDVCEIRDRIIYKKELQGTYWDGFNLNNLSKEGRVELENGKKPEALLYRIISMSTNKGDIVLDFFMGTGTTCAVAHKMGREYIGIEQLDYGENSAVQRLNNVINGDQTGISKAVGWQGSGDFVYMEPMKLNEDYIEKIQDAKDCESLLSIWDEMKLNGFLSYRVDPKLFDENIEEFKALSLGEQKRLLIETVDKNYLYVNYSEIDDEMYGVRDEDKQLNKKFYEGWENA